MGSSLFVYGRHWAKHIANLSMGRQPNRSISIFGLVIAERITRAIRRKILVSVFGRDMHFHVLSVCLTSRAWKRCISKYRKL